MVRRAGATVSQKRTNNLHVMLDADAQGCRFGSGLAYLYAFSTR